MKRSAREIAEELRQLTERGDSDRDRLSLLHEVHVYQEELIAQNEELTRSRATLEETRDRMIELYDFAPNGYLTLDSNGVILQINLTGAGLLGRPRQALEGMPLHGLVIPADRPRYLDYLRACRGSSSREVSVELKIQSSEGPKDVQLMCRPEPPDSPRTDLLTTMIDISERRRLEAERARAAGEHAALASRVLSAQDEERQRIARDLHDNLGQQVTALRLMLQAALMDAVSTRVRDRLEHAQKTVEQIDRHLDFLANELRPASLDLGLTSAVEQFVKEWSATFGIEAELRCGALDQVCLPHDVETHVYRVMQEALNNVYKHAHARRAVVVFERRDSDLVLTVEDDGHGFDIDARSRHHARGLGLIGMRERAQLAGGTLDIDSAPSGGTTIHLRVPIADRKGSR